MLVDERGVQVSRLAHVMDRRQRFEVQRDRFSNILGLGSRRRHAHGDELANVPHLAGR
jgi:hypothetical protein